MDKKNLTNIIQYYLKNPYKIGHLVGKTKLTELHNDWIKYCWLLDRFTSLLAHRGSYKTTSVVIIGAIYYLMLYPDSRIGIISKSFTDASSRLQTIKSIMEAPVIQELFEIIHKKRLNGKKLKCVIRRNNKLSWNFKKTKTPEGNINAYGIKTSLVGTHLDKIICDDIITLDDRLSLSERERTKEMVRELQTNILDPGKSISFVGTPWHKDDAWSICPVAARYDVYQTGFLSEDEIIKKRESTTSKLFAANYELKHISSENALFSDIKFDNFDYKSDKIVAQLDAAYDGKCTTGLTIIGKNFVDDKLYGVGFCYYAHIKFHIDSIIEKLKKYRVGSLYLEDNADKGFLADMIKQKCKDILVVTYHEKMNKHVKIYNYLFEVWKNLFYDKKTDKDYLSQISEYEEGIKPDDCPDSAASLIREAKLIKLNNMSLWEY